MGELGQFLDADAAVAQYSYCRPGPERLVFFAGEVAAPAIAGVLGPYAGGPGAGSDRPPEGLPARGEHFTRSGGTGGGEPAGGSFSLFVHRGDKVGKDGHAFAGPLIHARFTAGRFFAVRDLPGPDRAGHRPRSPPGRVVSSPLGDVEVEGPDRGQAVRGALPRAADFDEATIGLPAAGYLGEDPLLPRRRDRGGKAERVQAGMMKLQVPPEQAAEGIGEAHQRDMVDTDLAFPQVVSEKIVYRPVLDAAPADQLLRSELAVARQRAHGRRGGVTEHSGRVQELVEVRAPVMRDAADVG